MPKMDLGWKFESVLEILIFFIISKGIFETMATKFLQWVPKKGGFFFYLNDILPLLILKGTVE